jgi:PAS domain S-box-containing protein
MRTGRTGAADSLPEARLPALLRMAAPRSLADVVSMVILAAVYYVAARLSLRVALVEQNITPLWPPTGIALASFLIFGSRLWPGVAIGAFLVNLPITSSPAAAAVTATGNTLAPLVAATLLARMGFRPALDRLRDAIALVFVGALLSMTISATIGVGVLVATGSIASDDLLSAWSVWWAGDAMGVLVFAPFLLTLRPIRVPRPRSWRRALEASVLGIALLATTVAVLSAPPSLLFIVLPLIGWAAWRFQQRGAAPAALVVSVLATLAAVDQRGPFAEGTLLDRMLTLQAFNAAVAFTSFLFAALVAERMRDRAALSTWASELETRVDERTDELKQANDHLAAEVEERRRVESELRRSQAQLGDAQELARVGSYEWDIATGVVTWSDEMYRIHGFEPQEFPVTYERAVELVPPPDRLRIRQNVERALQRKDRRVADIDYPIELPDGTTRVLSGKARVAYERGEPVTMLGTVQDITERREYEREHRIAETLQRALLPKELPRSSSLDLAARYVPAEAGLDCGGDWYDVIELRNGKVALVIGDVIGHGLQAATVMGQLRLALRAYALEGHPPEIVVSNIDALVQQLHPDGMATLLYIELDAGASTATIVCAGHPPPLVSTADGGVDFLDVAADRALGVDTFAAFASHVRQVARGSTLVLYTDGLVDRRDLPIADGLPRLRTAVEEVGEAHVEDLCDRLLEALVPKDVSDDVAILAAHLVAEPAACEIVIPADPAQLSSVRARLSRWLDAARVGGEDRNQIVLACSEACANAIEHAYREQGGDVQIRGTIDAGDVEIVVRDRGRWRSPRNDDRGRGLNVMRACMDNVVVEPTAQGTVVRMRRSIIPTHVKSAFADR